MSGDVIRNVTVRVRVEQDQASLNAGSARGGGGGRGKTPEEEAAAAKAKADREAARANREAARQKREQERQDQQAARTAERARRDQERAESKARKDAEKALKEKTRAEQEAKNKAKEFANEQKAAITDAASATFEGATKMARGFVYLTASSEESMEANVKMIERFEGTVAAIEGGISTFTGLVKVYQTLGKTAKATAAANALLTASQVAANGTAKGGAAATVVGGVGSAVTAGGGALATAKGIGTMLVTTLKPVAATAGVLALKLAILTVAVGAAYEAIGRLTGIKSLQFFSQLTGLKSDRSNAASAEAKTAKMEKRRDHETAQAQTMEENIQANLEADQRIADAQRSTSESLAKNNAARQRDLAIAAQLQPLDDRRAKLLREMGQTDNPLLLQQGEDELERLRQKSALMHEQVDQAAELAAADKARAAASQRVTEAAKTTAAENEKVARTQKAGGKPVFAAAVHAAEQEKEARAALVDADQTRLGVLRQQEAALMSQREQAEAQLQTTQQQLRLEKDKERSGAAKFGRLTAPEQGQLKRISQKLQSGEELSDAEARFLDRTGFGERVAEEHHAARGRKEGFGGLDARLTGVDPTRQKRLQQDQTDQQHRVESFNNRIAATRQMIRMQEQSLENSIQAMGDAYVAALKAVQERVDREARRAKAGAK